LTSTLRKVRRDHYEEKGVFERLMDRLRRIVPPGQGYAPVMQPALR
jgi:hypothetical protein